MNLRERLVIVFSSGWDPDMVTKYPGAVASVAEAAAFIAEKCCEAWGHDWAPVRYDGVWRGPGNAACDDNCRRCGASWSNPEAGRIARMRNQQPFR